MLGDQSYVPVLKARDAEIKALLRAPRALAITPLFELQRAAAPSIDKNTGEPRRSKGTLTDASYFLDDIARLWDDPFYLDISRVSDFAKRADWWRLLTSLNALAPVPADIIPVLTPDSVLDERSAAARVAGVSKRAAVRVPMADWRNRLGGLSAVVPSIAFDLQVSVANVDVVLDWADNLERFALDDLVASTMGAIAALGGAHGRIVTVGTPNGGSFVQVGDWHPVRREWWLWLRLAHAGADVVYGDYALYSPADPVPVSPQYGHLRYSYRDKVHVIRRAKPPGGGGLGAAFGACCEELVKQPHCMPASFSKADQRFHDIAGNSDKETQAGKWRQLAAEHHFALVASQTASPPPPPPPGTP